jgi:poly(3-hydroxybutyrate) depolymerase
MKKPTNQGLRRLVPARFPFLLSSIFLYSATALATSLPPHSVDCGTRQMEYRLFVPTEGSDPLPALLLLHGAGDRAENFIQAWESFAKEKKIVLVAPQLPREEAFEPEAPRIFLCIMQDAAKLTSIDSHRVYLFGHSMGGYLAYDGAMLDSGFFAAAAIHAMGIADDYNWIVQRATRKIPIAIYIGTQDQLVSITQVRKTEAVLRKAGFPLHYQEMPGHDHNYYDLSDVINRDAWHFLEGYRAP